MSRTRAAFAFNRRMVSRRRRAALMLSGGLLALVTADPALGQAVDALPTGGTVVAGSATIGTPSPAARLDVTQSSDRAVISWNTFDIGQNAEVAFTQPSPTAIALNRVTGGGAPSQIAGKLTANGMVAVLNANGVVFAGTADVDVGGLIASSGQIDTAGFMAGGDVAITGATGGEIVVSAGADISVASAGLAAFVAPGVRNSGTITATAGRVQLAAGTAFTLDLAGDGLLEIGVGAGNPLVENLGGIFASGGTIQLSARQASAVLDQTINTGVLPVGSARLDGSTIVLDASGLDVGVAAEIAGRGNLVVSGKRISGAADLNVDGNLTLNVNAGGTVADSLASGNNWIADALGVIGSQVDTAAINLGAGLYRPGTVINASNVTIDGHGLARVGWISGIENAIDVWGDNVTIRNLEIVGPATSAYTSFAWGSTNSRGIFVNRFADNVSLLGNNVHDIRTGIVLDGRNLNTVVSGNRIDNTKSGISVQYTNGGNAGTSGLAGSSITLAGNFEGGIGNEWGINVHLNGIWDGVSANPGPSSSLVGGLPVGILGTAGVAEQQRLVALGAANNGMSVQNIAYSAANRTRSYVSTTGGGSNVQGSQLTPFSSIQNGINAVATGGTVNIANGTYNIGSSPISIVRGLTLAGASEAGVIIDGRGVGTGLGTMQVQADNVALNNFTLYGAATATNYGIKVQPNPANYSQNQRLLNFAVGNVTVRGSTRAELDLNGVVGASITNFTADGRRVDSGAQTAGAGVQVTDSANVTLTGVHTLGNSWGSVALYQANKANAYNGRTTNININAAQNTFEESIGLFSQLESTTQTFGQLNLTGFSYVVRNSDHRPDNLDSQFNFFRTSQTDAVNFAKTVGTASASSIEGYTGTAFSNTFTVVDGLSVNAALRDARNGATVDIGPGAYTESATGVGQLSGTGSYNFGLHVYKDDITLRGVGAGGNAITRADDVAAFITSQNQSVFGAQHFVSGTNVTIEGLGFKPAATGDNKMLEVIGDNFTLRNSVLDVRGNGTSTNFYISSFEGTPGADIVETFHLEDNIFYSATLPYDGVSGVGPAVTIAGGVGRNSAASNRVFADNRIIGGSLAGQRGFQIQGRIPTTPWQQLLAGAVTVTGNSFDNVDIPVRTIGQLTEQLAWDDVFRNNGNTYLDGAVLAYQGATTSARTVLNVNGDADLRITSKIGDSVARAVTGDTVRMLDGLYDLGATQLKIDKSIALVGQSQAGVVIDGRAVSADGRGTIAVQADNVLLSNFTLYGSELAGGNFGIKVQPDPVSYSPDQRLLNFAAAGVTVRGSRRAELDLNGVVGATIANFTADGRRVADSTATAGAGVQISDSANVTLAGVNTRGNEWGGVALYQTNSASGYNAQTTNVTISASQNTFEEAKGLFTQLESTTRTFGQLNLAGFNYVVRNSDHRPDDLDGQFAFFRTSLTDAIDFARTVGSSSASSIEGYTGTAFGNTFTVVDGLSVSSAVRDVRSGGTVNVGAGTYAETVSIGRSITLDGAGIDATSITGGLLLSGVLSNLVLSDFTVGGSGGNSVIGNGAAITGLTISGVRLDGQGVATRHGFSGGQVGGAISITNSEFVNIRNWAAFDTRSGAGTDQGSQISSAVFSNNLLDNTAGHIAFRQDIITANPAYPDVVISSNTVRNVGAATNSFGAIFKAFNANAVTFSGNAVSGVGTSGFNPIGEAAYGAALMVRGARTLSVTGNSFTNNNQVYAVEPGRGLPTVTNFSDNIFVNNAYAIYLPGDLAGSGTIAFGTGNTFVTGANTVRHIVWRSPSGLDLTGVAFDGTLASNLGLAQSFAVEDLITDGIDQAGFGLARLAGGRLFVTANSGPDAALRAVALGTSGDMLNLSAGTHALSDTLFLNKDIDLVGQGRGLTILDAGGLAGPGIRVQSDGVALSGFTLAGPVASTATAYGITVEAGGAAGARNDGFAISNVAIAGSRRAGLALNSVVGGTIDGVEVTGVADGAGIAITDSAGIVIRNSATSGNAGGGLALVQANDLAGGGSDQRLDSVTVETSNAFGERNGVYLQAASALQSPGALAVPGYGYTVRNSTAPQFTYFQKASQNALDFAVNLAAPGASVVQGWTGTANDRNFHVDRGALSGGGLQALSLQAAFNGSADGDTINVASGTYAESVTLAGTRALNFGTVSLNGMALSATGPGTSLKGSLTLPSGNFSAAGPILLNGSTSIAAASGNISLAGVSGEQALTLSGSSVMLGAANLASLAATGTGIALSGVTTTGAQSYIGPVTLAGSYSGSAFTVTGGSTLAGVTSIATTGDISFGALGGAQSLTLTGAGVTLGPANIGSLAATGTTIATSGVSTAGTQSYNGPVTLAGSYAASSFTANGATTLGGATGITAAGNIGLGTVADAHGLTLSGTTVTLGPVNIASLAANGTSITTAGVTTSGAQSYSGPLTLAGTYVASTFAASGPATLGAATSVSATGSIGFGTLGGAQELVLSGSDLALGAANLASLSATGTTIATDGVTTTGAQSYTGPVTLAGSYRGSAFAVRGPTTLGADTAIAASGDIALGALGGAHALTLSGTGVTLGTANLASLDVTGSGTVTSGVTTTGAQSYTGPVSLAGTYRAGDFLVRGAASLAGDIDVAATGAASFGSVDGLAEGPRSFTLAAETAQLGSLGQSIGLGQTSVTANEVVLGGSAYRAATLSFAGGSGATVRVTQDLTSFDTRPESGAIAILPHVVGTEPGRQSLSFVTGTGGQDDGDITLGNVGNNDVRIGDLTVIGGNFSAATVKLAGDFTSLLGGNQVFSSNTLDTLGNVHAAVTGNESGPIVAGGSVNVSAGGSGSGSIVAGGPVELAYQEQVTRAISSQSSVSLAAIGPVSGSITATGPVAVTANGQISTTVITGNSANIVSVAGVTSNVTAGGGVYVAATQGAVGGSISSNGAVDVNAVGAVTGSITATGSVAVTANGPISTTVITGNSANISSVQGVTSNIKAGGGVQLTATQGAVGGTINSGGPVNVNASGPVSTTVTTTGSATIASAGAVSSTVSAGGAVNVNAPQGGVSGSINAGGPVAVAAQGTISASVTSAGAASVVSGAGGVSSTINAAGPVSVNAPGAVTSTISSGSTVALTSNTPLNVQVTGGAVSVSAPGGQVTGVFGEISTDSTGTFVVNDQPVVGKGDTDARQIIIDAFLSPVGAIVESSGQVVLPAGLALALIPPSRWSLAGRPPVVVNSVQRLGELLRLGYSAIIIDIDETNIDYEEAVPQTAAPS